MSKANQSTNLRYEIGVPEGSPEIVVDGVRLAVAREGKGSAIVCLHAIGHGGRDFAAFTNAVSDRFEVIRIDWPGQGRSERDTKVPTARRYAELLDGVLTRLRISDPIIIGNSIGGAAAIVYASEHPVRALVLCDTGGIFEVTPALGRLSGLFARFFDAGARGAWWYRRAFALYYRLVLPSPAAAPQRRRIISAAYEIAGILRDAWRGFGMPEADIRDLAARLDAPVWFAWARGDRVIPLRYAKPAIDRMKRTRLTRFRGGHSAFLERPKQFTREFLKFAQTLNLEPTSLAAAR